MIVSILVFLLGVGLLVGGAWLLIGGGTRVAAILGVPSVVIGLTVVAFGTSAPELFVSAVGAWKGSTALVLGNVIGSNVANLGIILATAALIRPVIVERGLVRGEFPLLLAVSILFAGLTWDGELSRVDAAVLLVIFVGFMYWTLRDTGRGAPQEAPAYDAPGGHMVRAIAVGLAMVAGGVLGLAFGGHLIITSALDLALRLGASETLIGLTLVAVGTSLPELATTIVAATRREDDLAVGNIVGSNLFNILAVAGPVGLYRPLREAEGGVAFQLVTMVMLTVLVFVMILVGRGALGRGRGAALLSIYVAIMIVWTSAA
ncbi:MAG: calcium/sodium antiporter [bacterium]|nr:calcium/sodium antiporter [bacterium]